MRKPLLRLAFVPIVNKKGPCWMKPRAEFLHKGNLRLTLLSRFRSFLMLIPPRPATALLQALAQCQPAPVLPLDLNGPTVARLDFGANNPRLTGPLGAANLRDTAAFTRTVAEMLAEKNATTGIGGYLENRVIYRRSPHFGPAEPTAAEAPARSLHLGVDVWAPAGTPILAPLPATIHSLADNNNFGDYGPTVILEHTLAGIRFFSLYGHLTRREWASLQPGQALEHGETFTTIGPYPENGDWPPHLHFQLITDLQGRYGDFPGVAPPAEQAYWAALCPNPNLLLRSRHLE